MPAVCWEDFGYRAIKSNHAAPLCHTAPRNPNIINRARLREACAILPGPMDACSGCAQVGPCVSQGLCLDPTVLTVSPGEVAENESGILNADLASSPSSATAKLDAHRQAFLIEGQLLISSPGGAWQSTTLRTIGGDSAICIKPQPMTSEECVSLGLPGDPSEARAILMSERAEAVPHGDHMDFVVNGRLVHVVDGGGAGAGEDCNHSSTPAFFNHGSVTVARSKLGSEDATVVGGTGRYMPLVRRTPYTKKAGGENENDNTQLRTRLLSPADVRLVVDAEHAGGSEQSAHTRLKVYGICCPSEVPLIHSILDKRRGIRSVKVVVPTKTVLVEHAPSVASASSILDALNKAQLQASIAGRGGDGVDITKEHGMFGIPLPPWTVLVACVLLALYFLHYAGGALYHLRWAALGAAAIAAPPICRKAFESLKHYVVDINALMMIAVAGACVLQEFGEAATVVVLFGFSEWLEDRAIGRASTAMGAVLALRPERACRLSIPDESVLAEDILIGEVVLVRPGQKVPLDGIVVGGGGSVDEAALTGESVPVIKSTGSKVYGGTVNQGGVLEVRVTASASDSAVARLVRMVEEAQAQKSVVERAIETFAKHYTPVVVVAASLLATVPFLLGETDTKYMYMACVLLVVSCPCALVLSTPVVAVCGLTRAARRGMLVKGSAHLERLGRLKTVCVDKTGTLTEGAFALTAVKLAAASIDPNVAPRPALGVGALLRWACAIESRSSHPVAAAVLAGSSAAVRIAAEQCVVVDYETLPGEGIGAVVDGKLVEIGGPALAARRRWAVRDPALASIVSTWETAGATAVWVGLGGVVAGAFRCEDATRSTAMDAVTRLKKLGVEVVMLTGDNAGSARAVAARVGIDPHDVHARLTPADKMAHVIERVARLEADAGGSRSLRRRFRGRQTLAMVGDGINDAPALGAADVGIAMGVAGTAAAMETADVALLTNDLGRVGETIEIGRLCLTKIRQNIIFSICAKAVVLVLSLIGYTGLWEAVIADVGTALVVILNGMTILDGGKAATTREDGAETLKCVAAAAGVKAGGGCGDVEKGCRSTGVHVAAATAPALGKPGSGVFSEFKKNVLPWLPQSQQKMPAKNTDGC